MTTENNHSSPEETFSFSFPLEGSGPQVQAPSRFAAELKRARFRKGWTQAEMARQLSLPKRAVVSWETAERIPSVGMVVVLLGALIPEGELSLHHDLLCAYIADDLSRLESRKDQDASLLLRIQETLKQVVALPAKGVPDSLAKPPLAEEEENSRSRGRDNAPDQTKILDLLFALLAQLHRHPELISVANDFLTELAPDQR